MRRKDVFFQKHHILLLSFIALGIMSAIAVMVPSERARTASVCSEDPVKSTTFIKTHHLRDLTDGFSILPTKDGGYVISGDTLAASGMAIPNPFLTKANAKGDLMWSRQFSSQSLPPRDSSTRHEPHVAVETTDGGIVVATDIVDFIDAAYEESLEVVGDILVTKTNSKGVQIWSVMLGEESVDRPQKMWALPDGGVLLLARIAQTGYGTDVADIDAVSKHSVFITIDKSGNVQSSKKMDWEVTEAERLADGSFIVLADITIPKTEQPEGIVGPEVAMTPLPTAIRLNSALNVEWAKSLEMIPSEMNTLTSITDGAFTMGKTKIRMMGGDFRAIQQTPDGGFLAVGFENVLLTQGLSAGGLKEPITSFTSRSLVAVKLDAAGWYQWTKKVTVPLTAGLGLNDFQMTRTVDGNFVIMQDVVRDSASIEAKSNAVAEKQKVFSDACKEIGPTSCLDTDHLPKEVQPLFDAVSSAVEASNAAFASNILLLKFDANLRPMWIKKIDTERDVSGYAIAPTLDRGVVVSGSMLTTKLHKVLLSMEPYKEAIIIKTDVNGNVNGAVGVTDVREVSVSDQSSYLVTQDMDVGKANDETLTVLKKVKEKVWTIKDTVRGICGYKSTSIKPSCAYLASSASPSESGQTGTSAPEAKTWALINYENTNAVAVEGEKNLAIHHELLPVLNEVYHTQVKVKDSMKSMWLTYIFPRLTTRADVEAVQKAYEGLGYHVDESDGGNLWVSKVGQTLHMTFSIQNSMVGKVEVLF